MSDCNRTVLQIFNLAGECGGERAGNASERGGGGKQRAGGRRW